MNAPMETAIPTRLNLALVLLVSLMLAGLLLLASRVDGWWVAVIAVIFSCVFVTNFALMHEASHRVLHPRQSINDALGTLTGIWFPTSATLMRVTHEVHHRCNRTDHEMFDYYYPEDRRLLRVANWYAILLGGFYLIIPPGALIVGFARPLLLTKPFRQARNAAILYDDFTPTSLRRVRWEALLVLAVWGSAFASGLLSWAPTLLLYAAAAINWGSRQYVSHAWSPRRIMDGAHNLATNRLHQAMLLNGNWDLVHHLYPTASWIHLAALGATSKPAIPYVRQWLSQWGGPRLATEPDPRVASPPAAAPAV
jgi:fatty acid desaturase